MRPQRFPAASELGPRATPRTSVVVPAVNDAENLRLVLAELQEEIDEVILVDGWADDTAVIEQGTYPEVRIVPQEGRGPRDALAAGFGACRGDNIVTLVGEGSTHPREILAFVVALGAGADFANGSRSRTGGSDDVTPL